MISTDRSWTDDRFRSGLTLVECLVVIVVISVLLLILLPAVQAGRESARRTRCLGNLRQIGVGLANYESSHGCLPAASSYRNGSSYLVSALPFLENEPLYNSINFYFSASDLPAQNTTAQTAVPGLVLCPSDMGLASDPGGFGWTSYAGSRGGGIQRYGENGAFRLPPGSIVRIGEFTDGTSATAVVSEWLLGRVPIGVKDAGRSTFHTPNRHDGPDELDRFAAACRSLDIATARVNFHQKGMNWMHGEFGATLYNHAVELQGRTCLNGTGFQIGAWTAGSLHPGGCNVLFGDGNARFLRQSVNLQVWRALGSRNGGEAISSSNF